MFEETTRQVIITLVVAVLVVRTPFMAGDRRQRPLWLMLVVFAGGSVVIQSWFGAAINDATGVSQFNNLVQGVWGILNMAVTLEFVVRLAARRPQSRGWQAGRVVAAAGSASLMALLFALTPPSQRFAPPDGVTTFTAYALTAAAYMICTSVIVTWMICRHLRLVHSRTLFAALVMLAVGNATQVPFMTIRTVQRLSTYATPDLLDAAFILNTTRFILVPTGCMVAAMEPARTAALFYYRRIRLYGLWRLLRASTPDLVLAPPTSRPADLLAVTDPWERLHRRVVEIRDSVFHLYDTWASPELLNEALRHGARESRPSRRRVITIACWLEVTRRHSLAGQHRIHADLDRSLLPELQAEQSTMGKETRYLRRLHRALRSREVRDFADQFAAATPAPPVTTTTGQR